jgi:hypothetical protein
LLLGLAELCKELGNESVDVLDHMVFLFKDKDPVDQVDE